MKSIWLTTSVNGLESDFLKILVGISKEKLVDQGDIREEILGVKTTTPHQASRVQAFIIMEIEGVLNMFSFIDLELCDCLVNINFMNS